MPLIKSINEYLKPQTRELKMVDGPIPQDIVMFLINAIYFKDWTNNLIRNTPAEFQAETAALQWWWWAKWRSRSWAEDGFKRSDFIWKRKGGHVFCGGRVNVWFIRSLDQDHWKMIRDSISERDQVCCNYRFQLEYSIAEWQFDRLRNGEATVKRLTFR